MTLIEPETQQRVVPLTKEAEARRATIGIVDAEKSPSGMTRYVLALLDGIDKQAFDVVLFCRKDGPYQSLPAKPGVRVVHLPGSDVPQSATSDPAAPPRPHSSKGSMRNIARTMWRTAVPQTVKHLVGFLKDAKRTRSVFQANPVDLLHVQIVSNSKAVVAGRMAGIPKILGTHHLDPGRTRLHQLMPEILTSRRLDHAIAVSHSTKAAWAGRPSMGAAKLSVIPNGVDVEQYRRQLAPAAAREKLGMPVDAAHVLSVVGRLEEQKGHRYLLEAFAQVLHVAPGAHLAFAGDGTLRVPLGEQCKTMGIDRHVHFLGHCEGVQAVLDASDVFVLPSLWEAMPFAALEAMAAGLPVVATAVAGVPELVDEGETGLLVPPKDVDGLRDALLRMLHLPDAGRALGVAGQRRVNDHFSLRSMLTQTQDLYRQLLGSTRLNS